MKTETESLPSIYLSSDETFGHLLTVIRALTDDRDGNSVTTARAVYALEGLKAMIKAGETLSHGTPERAVEALQEYTEDFMETKHPRIPK